MPTVVAVVAVAVAHTPEVWLAPTHLVAAVAAVVIIHLMPAQAV